MSKKEIKFNPKNILRYPRLDTVLMVENKLQKYEGYFTKTQLWKSLPKKTMYQTFNLILEYLEYSGKIYIDNSNKIVWIWDPNAVNSYLTKKAHLVVA